MARPSRWNEVVASSAKVFRQRGFANATVEEIADDLGMLKGSLYNYIKTKEDLLAAVIEVPADRLIRQATEIAESDAGSEQKLRALIECHITTIVEISDFAAVYLHEHARHDLDGDWKLLDKKYARLVESVIAEAADAGELRADINPHVAAMNLIGACNWLTQWWNPEGYVGRDDLIEQISKMQLCGMLKPKPQRAPARTAQKSTAVTARRQKPRPPAQTR